MCPKIPGNYTIYADSDFDQFYSSLSFVVDYCDTIADITGVPNPNCNTDHTEVLNYVSQNVKVYHKFVRQYFDPDTYDATETMAYTEENRYVY